MTFDYPIILFSFIIFIPIIVYRIFNRNKKIVLSLELKKKSNLSSFFFYLFLITAIIAMAGPKWGMGYAPSEFRRGLDIVYAVDISRSMDVQDAQTSSGLQSRLERGLSIAQESLITVTGARYAVAIGRSRGYLAVPLTHDSEAALVFLESIDTSSITGRSTNLEALVGSAVNAFQSSSPARRVIVLISDGEAHTGVLRNALNRCTRDGIIVTTVAVGSDEGRPIIEHVNDQISDQSVISRTDQSVISRTDQSVISRAAQSVISRRDASVMRSAAERTGGIYIDANRDDAVSLLSGHLLSLAQEIEFTQTIPNNDRREPKQRRTLFIILTLLFYSASKLVTRTNRVNYFQSNMVSLPLLFFQIPVLFSMLFFSSCSEGKLLLLHGNYLSSRGRFEEAITRYSSALNHEEAAPYAEYGLGIVFHSLDEGETALRRYNNSQILLETLSANEHRELRFRNLCNSGIVFFEEEDYHSAADAFRDALRILPGRIEAKRNLELSLLSISIEANSVNIADNLQEQKEILFEFLRQEEQQKWRSREWAPEEDFSVPDY
jgi:Ca-activated chloride channel family protein